MTKNLSVYVFPEINTKEDLAKLEFDQRILDTEFKKQKVFGPDDVIRGTVIDRKAFEKKQDKLIILNKKKTELTNRLKLSQLKYTPLDYNEMTIGQIKSGLLIDTHMMFNELINLPTESFGTNLYFKNIYEITGKKYRRITILLILLIFFIICYVMCYILLQE